VNPIIQYFVYRSAKTDKAKKKAMFCGNYPYDLRYPKMMMMFLLALVYSTIFPLITAFGTLYFFMFWLCESYEAMHMRNLPYESESKAFPTVHNRGVVGLFVFQLTMAGVFGLNQNAEAGALTLPLLLVTIAYGIYAHRKYTRRVRHFSLDYALDLDALPRPVFGGEDHDYYDPVEDSARVEPSIVHPDGHVEERRMPKRLMTAQELAARQDNFYIKHKAGMVLKLRGSIKKFAGARATTDQGVVGGMRFESPRSAPVAAATAAEDRGALAPAEATLPATQWTEGATGDPVLAGTQAPLSSALGAEPQWKGPLRPAEP
jgi:hypothetical protein